MNMYHFYFRDIQTGLLEDHVLSKARSWNLKQIVLYSVSVKEL